MCDGGPCVRWPQVGAFFLGVRREAPPPSDGPNNYFAEHGVLIGGCVAGGLAAVFALSRVLARFS